MKRAAQCDRRTLAVRVVATDAAKKQADDIRNDKSLQIRRRSVLAGLTLAVQALQPSSYSRTANAATTGRRMPSAAEVAALEKAFAKDVPKSKAPAVLRVAFHDAGTFRLASNDLIAYGGAYAVRITGGPDIKVPIGRLDVAQEDPEGRMPAETLSPTELKEQFAAMGFTTQELVAISGAHTIGGWIRGQSRFYNAYYSTLIDKPWKKGTTKEEIEMAMMIGLPSDKLLPEDDDCLKWINKYAEDQDAFFRDFSAAYLKMIDMGATYA